MAGAIVGVIAVLVLVYFAFVRKLLRLKRNIQVSRSKIDRDREAW